MPMLRFGLIFWVVWRALALYLKLNRKFSGRAANVDGLAVEHQVVRDKDSVPIAINLALPIPDRFRFVLRREEDGDRLAQRLGLVDEVQTGDPAFDSQVYVLADDRKLRAALIHDAALRAALCKLFADASLGEVRANAGRLWITVRPSGLTWRDKDEQVTAAVLARHGASLVAVRDRLDAADGTEWSDDREPTRRIESAIYVLCFVLVVLALFAGLRSTDVGFPRILAPGELERRAGLLAVGLVACGAIAAILLLRGSARVHLVLIEIALTALPATWFVLRAAALEYNVRADRSPPALHVLRIEAKEARIARTGRRNRATFWYVHVDGWPVAGIDRRFQVSGFLYRHVQQGDCVRIDLRPGRLDAPWLRSFVPVDCGYSLQIERGTAY